MSDLIRREDAIKAIEELPNAYNGWSDAYDKAYIIGTLEEVPSADRPRGEWKDTGKDPDHSHPLTAIWYRCSECGYGTNAKTNFCPDCGARMKGADDE